MDQVINCERVDISVIVPVFNVEKYLVRCLDSIFSQKFSGRYEVISVEDGSTDISLQILKSYQDKEPRLKIIEHGINKKLSIARGTGMNASTGEYIMHLDSDDWLLPDSLEKLFRICLETDADIVVFNHALENITGKRTFSKSIKKEFITTDKLKVQQHFYGAPWNKIVKRELTKNMIYVEVGINTTEDLLYATEILLKAGKICLLPEYCYVYFVNVESLSRLIKSEKYLKHQIIILRQLQKIVFKYKANLKFTRNILNYFEKWIYLEFAKVHFWGNTDDLFNCSMLVNELFQIPVMTPYRISRLKLSIKNKYINLLEVASRFGLKLSLGIILRSFKR